LNVRKISCPYIDRCRDYPEKCQSCKQNIAPSFFEADENQSLAKKIQSLEESSP